MLFRPESAAVVWVILESIFGFDPSLEMIGPRFMYFLVLDCASKLSPFILISSWKLFGLFVNTFILSEPFSILCLVVVVSRRSSRTSVSSSCFSIYKNFVCKGHVRNTSRHPMLTLLSRSGIRKYYICTTQGLKMWGFGSGASLKMGAFRVAPHL